MPGQPKKIYVILLIIIGLFINKGATGQGIAIEPIQKDSIYSVRILYNGVVLAVDEIPFSIYFSNIDGTATASLTNPKAFISQTSRDEIHLAFKVFLPDLTVDLSGEILYTVINQNVLRKSIRLFQASMPGLKYILEEKNYPGISTTTVCNI